MPNSVAGGYKPGTKVVLTAQPELGYAFVKWQGSVSGLLSPLTVTMNSDVNATAIFASDLAIALDAPEQSWDTGGAGPWFAQRFVSHDGRDAGESATLTQAGQSWASTYVDGPATVSFWWKLPAGSASTLQMLVDGVVNQTAAASDAWAQRNATITAGRHLVTWIFTKPTGAAATPERAWLDEVTIDTSAAVSLPQALDAAELPWTTDRLHPWFGSELNSHDGSDVAASVLNGEYLQSWVETRVTGGGVISFFSRNQGGSLQMLVDGTATAVSSSGWKQFSVPVAGDGPHILRWVFSSDTGASYAVSNTAYLDEVVWAAGLAKGAQFTLTQALDLPTQAWATGGKAPWKVTAADSSDSVDAAQSGAIGKNAESWIETRFAGPGVLRFYWKTATGNGKTYRVFVDGEESSLMPSAFWSQGTLNLPAGLHTVRWRFAKDATTTNVEDSAWLDRVIFIPVNNTNTTGTLVPALADATDIALSYFSGGNVRWASQTAVTHDTADAAKAGIIGNSQETWMEATVSGEGTLTFWWKVSSESGYDYLRLNVDGAQLDAVSGNVDWVQKSYAITGTGSHVLRWSYTKDGSASSGSDAGWVDQVAWSGAIPPVTTLVDPPSLIVSPQAGSYPLTVVTGNAWTATSNVPWSTLSLANGTGSATVMVQLAAQIGTKTRQGTLTIAGKTVTVKQDGWLKPVLGTDAPAATGGLGNAFTLAAPASYNFPVKFTAAGLPAGLVIDPQTGAISGIPTQSGVFHVKITAANPGGSSAALSTTINVRGPALPMLTANYTGLVESDTTLNKDLGGVLSFTVAKGNAVTGSLRFGQTKHAFKGKLLLNLSGNPAFIATIPRGGTLSALTLNVTIDVSGEIGSLSGTVSDAGAAHTANVFAWRNVWDKANTAKAYAAAYTAVLEPRPAGDETTPVPEGNGYLFCTVAANGVVKWKGKLADGMALNGASILWPTGEFPLYAPFAKDTGSVLGLAAISSDRMVSGRLDCTRKPQAASRSYPLGFTAFGLSMEGGPYQPPAAGSMIFGLSDQAGNAMIEFSGGRVESAAQFLSLMQPMRITLSNLAQLASVGGGNPAGVFLKLNVKTAIFTGGFTLTDSVPGSPAKRAVVFEGILAPDKTALGRGFFFLPSLPADATPSPIFSGAVELLPVIKP